MERVAGGEPHFDPPKPAGRGRCDIPRNGGRRLRVLRRSTLTAPHPPSTARFEGKRVASEGNRHGFGRPRTHPVRTPPASASAPGIGTVGLRAERPSTFRTSLRRMARPGPRSAAEPLAALRPRAGMPRHVRPQCAHLRHPVAGGPPAEARQRAIGHGAGASGGPVGRPNRRAREGSADAGFPAEQREKGSALRRRLGPARRVTRIGTNLSRSRTDSAAGATGSCARRRRHRKSMRSGSSAIAPTARARVACGRSWRGGSPWWRSPAAVPGSPKPAWSGIRSSRGQDHSSRRDIGPPAPGRTHPGWKSGSPPGNRGRCPNGTADRRDGAKRRTGRLRKNGGRASLESSGAPSGSSRTDSRKLRRNGRHERTKSAKYTRPLPVSGTRSRIPQPAAGPPDAAAAPHCPWTMPVRRKALVIG